VPSLSFVGPNILLNIFFSFINFHIIDSFSTHVSLTSITGLIIVHYSFNLAFCDTDMLLNIFFIGIITFIDQSNSFFNFFFSGIISMYN